ncbi:MAG TPA: tetratricopeptide repeat protein [bacterium]|nr:tetratricopeptide repeat protein [bacterium]
MTKKFKIIRVNQKQSTKFFEEKWARINKTVIWCIGIFLFVFLFRLFYFVELRKFPLSQYPVLDSKVYDTWAQEITTGDWLSKKRGVFYSNPGYAYFLAGVYSVFGRNLNIVIIIQFLFGALSCVLIYLIGKRVFNSTVGIIAGFIAGVYGFSIYIEGLLLTATLINFCNLFVLLCLLMAVEKKRFRYWFGAGIFLGVSTLLRPNNLLFAPFVLIWILWLDTPKKSLFYSFLSFFLGILLMVFPIIIRHYIVAGEFSLFPTAHGGLNFYIGNNPKSTGSYVDLTFDQADPESQGENYRRKASEMMDRELSRSEASRFWFLQGFKFIRQHPLQWLKLLRKKFLYFWYYFEQPMTYNYYFFKEHISFLKLPFLSFSFIAPLGLLGFILSILHRKVLLLHLYLLSHMIAVILFFVVSEYRYPIVGPLIIFASYSFYWYKENIKCKKYKSLVLVLILFAGMLYLTNHHRTQKTKYNFGRDYIKLGYACIQGGLIDQGIEFMKKSGEFISHSAVHYNLAEAYAYQKGQYDKAIEEYKKAIETEKNKTDLEHTYIRLAFIYIKKKMYNEAIKVYKKAVELNPQNAGTHQFLGNVYYLQNKKSEAIKEWKTSLQIYPDNPPLLKNLKVLKEEIQTEILP